MINVLVSLAVFFGLTVLLEAKARGVFSHFTSPKPTYERVKPHSSEYLHYLMQCRSTDTLTQIQGSYSNKPSSSNTSSSSSTSWYSHIPFGYGKNRFGLSEENTGFQPRQEQDVADKCINVPPCNKSTPYRTINGSCNNFNFPMWGMAGTAMVRLVPARYHDGVNELRKAKSGKELPNVRELRTNLFKDKDRPDVLRVLNCMQWGQSLAHETTGMAQQDSAGAGLNCCSIKSKTQHKACLKIQVPRNDSFYSQHNKTCLNFVRSMTTDNFGCKLTPQQHVAHVTQYIDAGIVYGSDEVKAKSLRTFSGGKLKVQQTSDYREFPMNSNNIDRDCDNEGSDKVCYNCGDDRANQNTGITLYQILLLREHNRLCSELSSLNPQWNDETLYQEARRILVAIVQKITYSDYLPIIIGWDFIKQLGIEDGSGSDPHLFNAYDPSLNAATTHEFASCAFRFFHSMVPSHMELYDENFQLNQTLKMSKYFFRPTIIQKSGMFDNMIRGLAIQSSQSADTFFARAMTDYLFKSNKPFGTDLESIDLQRGRDHGLPSYNDMRVGCGLTRVESFSELEGIMSKQYECLDDIDLFVAGVHENPAPQALVGPTFQCIIGEQFRRWRNGDRFYFEFGNQTGSFTPEQLWEIRKVTCAALFCRNGDNITKIQPDVFRAVSDNNPLQSCESIVKMSLDPWKQKSCS